jgi:hypothetical protein
LPNSRLYVQLSMGVRCWRKAGFFAHVDYFLLSVIRECLQSRHSGFGKMPRGDKPCPSISTLLTRNLHDVFGENDPARRRAAIDEIFTEDCVFYEPRGVYRGRDEIDRVTGAIKATHPDFRYQPIAGPEELGNCGRLQWVSAPW